MNSFAFKIKQNMKMPPLSIIEDSIPTPQIMEDQAQSLAIDLVIKYLKSVTKCDKLAKKFEEKVPSPKISSTNIKDKENITIEEVLKKHQLKTEEGVALNPALNSVVIYKFIQKNASDKIAEKFAKKNKFSYEKITPNLSKKEQKLSLDRACLKYLKKNVETDNPLNTSTNDSSKKRSIDNGNESEENDLQTPKAKKKKASKDIDEPNAVKIKPEDDSKDVVEPPKAPKNNKPCFKCNQPGHFAKDCTSEITCYNCSKVGHTSKECPNITNPESDMVCYNCNETGHSKRNCPEISAKKNFDMECYHCKETGHLSRDCTKDGGVACYNCGSNGHLSRNCTQSADRLCYNCKKPGHLSKDCTVEDGENSKLLCFKCNEYGHMARSCKNVADNPRRRSGNNGNIGRGGMQGRGGMRGRGGRFTPKFTTAANSIPLGPRKMPGEINKGSE